MDSTKHMTNEQAEKEWQELFQKATWDFYDDNVLISMERAEKFIRANLSQVPEVRGLVELVKDYDDLLDNLIDEQGIYKTMRKDIKKALKPLKGIE